MMRFLFSTTVVLLAVSGCGGSGPTQQSAPAVTVSVALEREVVEWDEYPGRLESPLISNVTARVGGLIVSAPFTEGSLVTQGAVLFEIDDRPYKAEFSSKEADVARANAQLNRTQLRFQRINGIKNSKAVSAQDVDQARADVQSARADVNAALAALDIARLNLEWTKVTAPISGRVSRKLITEGNLISAGAGQPTTLTTITSVDPLYCYVTVPERKLQRYQALIKELAAQGAGEQLAASVKLETESTFAHRGTIDFFDNRVDPSTGTIQIRAMIQNPDGALTSGLFARLRIPGSKPYKALLVPETAAGTDQTSKFLSVIDEKNTVTQKRVTLGAQFGKLRAVTDGLTGTDRFVVSGMQIARPNTVVNPTLAPIDPGMVADFESPFAAVTPRKE